MARVTFVKKARKAIRNSGIKAGDSYYWWKFRHGGKHVSKTPPRASQLTQSEYLSSMYGAEEGVSDALTALTTKEKISVKERLEALADTLESAKDTAEEQRDNCENSLSNMPDQLQDSDTGQLLQSRIDACDSLANDLESTTCSIRDLAEDTEKTDEEKLQEADTEVGGISWDIGD